MATTSTIVHAKHHEKINGVDYLIYSKNTADDVIIDSSNGKLPSNTEKLSTIVDSLGDLAFKNMDEDITPSITTLDKKIDSANSAITTLNESLTELSDSIDDKIDTAIDTAVGQAYENYVCNILSSVVAPQPVEM